MKLIFILMYLLLLSTGKPDRVDEFEHFRVEWFFFNFDFFGMSSKVTFYKNKND